MKSAEIRQLFFDFFTQRGHTKVPSSSLIPAQDPTLLFANAGMNQFKDVFLGKETRSYKRAISIQKCMRAGGKHNDLDNVGFTSRHLTFFEMMGNFSFGDYFKEEAIQYAWDFLTKYMHFNPATLYASVYKKDDESYAIWHTKIALPKDRIVRLGEADNFWQMGDTGPCGPCSEIYVDRGTDKGCRQITCAPGCSCDRFLEIWNLVFMQYDRQPDGIDKPLKAVGVDTGMGIERLSMIAQQKDSVFTTDLFAPIIAKIVELTNVIYETQDDQIKAAFHVLADHSRASCFLIADGVSPSNDGRGYVLRKIIRRAALFSKKLTDKAIFPQLASVIIQEMSPLYPELKKQESAIKALLNSEVEKFSTNLIHGQSILDRYFKELKGSVITGEQAFKLYDTYGFPLEITRIIAQEKGFEVDIEGFERFMNAQKERSGKKEETATSIELPTEIKTQFTGYDQFKTISSIIAIIYHNKQVTTLEQGQEGWIITKESPFYVERGGQVSDQGWIIINAHKVPIKALKRFGEAIAISIETPVNVALKQEIELIVDRNYRLDIMNNHTATHLLQAALIQLLGNTVRQSGSLVAPDYLRFDFTYHEAISSEQLKQVEDVVNEKIRENIPVSTFYATYQKAIDKGVIAIFGEKYNPENVRVVDIPGFSAELCGGTHVRMTGDIGYFKITESTALSAGQRRIVAVTGRGAGELFQQTFNVSKQLGQEFKVQIDGIVPAIAKQKEQLKQTQDALKQLKQSMLKAQIPVWLNQQETIHELPFLWITLENATIDELRQLAHDLLEKKPGLYVLYTQQKDQSSFVASVSPTYETKIDLKSLAEWLQKTHAIRSGGKKDMIQGGGPLIDPEKLKKSIKQWIAETV